MVKLPLIVLEEFRVEEKAQTMELEKVRMNSRSDPGLPHDYGNQILGLNSLPLCELHFLQGNFIVLPLMLQAQGTSKLDFGISEERCIGQWNVDGSDIVTVLRTHLKNLEASAFPLGFLPPP